MRNHRAVVAPLALALAMSASLAGAQQRETRPDSYARYDDATPVVDVWLDQFSYTSGERIRPYFESENGAYITLVRVTTDGRLYVLYPARPNQQRRYAASRNEAGEVPFSSEPAYYINEPPGTGIVFAIASFDRFDYARFSWGTRWRDPQLASRLADPFAVVNQFVSQTLDVRSAYTFDYEQYEVRRGGRYAGRFRYGNRFYGDDAYYSCVTQFGIGNDYWCHSYGIIYGGPVLIGRTRPTSKPNTPKTMTLRPLVHDPMLPTPGRLNPPATTGRAGTPQASSKTYESMRRRLDAPRPEPSVKPGFESRVRSEPMQIQRYEPRAVTPEPRVVEPQARVFREQPRAEQPRVEQPRVERPRVEPSRVETPRVEHRQIETSRPAPRVEKQQKDQ